MEGLEMTSALLVCIIMQLDLVDQRPAEDIARRVILSARAHDLDPLLVLAVAVTESRLKHRVINRATHDYGIMQLHCPSRDYAPWCRPRCLRSLACNIAAGTAILARQKRRCTSKHRHRSHWIRHYNWRNKKYDVEVLSTYKRLKGLIHGCPG
jgi:hypothetical protein